MEVDCIVKLLKIKMVYKNNVGFVCNVVVKKIKETLGNENGKIKVGRICKQKKFETHNVTLI